MNRPQDQDPDSGFPPRLRAHYAAWGAGFVPEVLARLAAARQRAVAEATRHRPVWQQFGWRLPAGAAAAVLAGILTTWIAWDAMSPAGAPFASTSNTDMAIVLSNDNLDMYANMDFYRWLQAQQSPASASEPGPRTQQGGNG